MLDAVFLCCWIFSWCSSIEVVRCHHSRNVWTINVTLFFSSDRWDVKISFVCIAKYGYDFIKGIVGLLVCVNMLCKFFPFKNFLNCCWDFYLQNAIFTVFTYSLSLFVCNSLPAMFFTECVISSYLTLNYFISIFPVTKCLDYIIWWAWSLLSSDCHIMVKR